MVESVCEASIGTSFFLCFYVAAITISLCWPFVYSCLLCGFVFVHKLACDRGNRIDSIKCWIVFVRTGWDMWRCWIERSGMIFQSE